jgi:uncharacterized protein YprB with RNaseH-like and TPR domain
MTQIIDSSIKSENTQRDKNIDKKEQYENLIGLITYNMNDVANLKKVYEYAQHLLYEEMQEPGG